MQRLTAELPHYLYYHNAAHTLDVYEAAGNLAVLGGISDYETQLLLTAASFHDSGFLACTKGHEKISCDIARDLLPGYGFTQEETGRICGIIMATRIPQEPKNHLEKILSDADLDYLGRDDFQLISNRLFLELTSLGQIVPGQEWDRRQVQFMELHQYFTAGAKELRQAKKEENLKYIKAKLC